VKSLNAMVFNQFCLIVAFLPLVSYLLVHFLIKNDFRSHLNTTPQTFVPAEASNFAEGDSNGRGMWPGMRRDQRHEGSLPITNAITA